MKFHIIKSKYLTSARKAEKVSLESRTEYNTLEMIVKGRSKPENI